MRAKLAETILDLQRRDSRVVLLTCGVGIYGFRKSFDEFPDRTIDLGIREQAAVGVVAGLSKAGMLPVLFTIAPFLAERALEQIKLDIALSNLPVMLVSCGASYDYSREGPTHHGAGDVAVLYNVPGVTILVPGHPHEVNWFLLLWAANPCPVYLRLSAKANQYAHLEPGIIHGFPESRKLVIATGPILDTVLEVAKGLPVTVAYTNRVRPMYLPPLGFDNILTIEPFYPIRDHYGARREFRSEIGTPEDLQRAAGLSVEAIRKRIIEELA